MREVAAELERPVLLFSGGKDSIVLLRLAEKAFRPGAFPFPVLHVDTGHNFPEVLEFRDRRVERARRAADRRLGAGVDRRRARAEEQGPSRNRLQTVTLLDAIEDGTASTPRSAAPAATRSAPGRRSACFSFRDEFGQWDPRAQRPEVWNLYNGRVRRGRARARVPALELDRARRLALHRAPRSSSCRRSTSPTSARVFERDGMLLAESEWLEPGDGEEVFDERVRYRTVGDMTVTGAVRSEATDARRRDRRDRGHARLRARRDARRRPRRPPPRWRTASARATSRCDLLRLATAGSVDDGKSTLIGRLLLDAKLLLDDQLEALHHHNGDGPDLALDHRRPARRARAGHHDRRRLPLLRTTDERSFIIADTPGPRALHAQHGHRRLDRRPRADPDRRAQRASSTSRAATPACPRCSASGTWSRA